MKNGNEIFAEKMGMIKVRTRTGRKVHYARPGSSVMFCGHWLKTLASNMEVDPEAPVTCEHCNGEASRRRHESPHERAAIPEVVEGDRKRRVAAWVDYEIPMFGSRGIARRGHKDFRMMDEAGIAEFAVKMVAKGFAVVRSAHMKKGDRGEMVIHFTRTEDGKNLAIDVRGIAKGDARRVFASIPGAEGMTVE